MAAALVSHPDLTHSSLIKRREHSQEGTVAVSLPTYSEEGEIRSSEEDFFYGYRIAGGSGKQMKVGGEGRWQQRVSEIKKCPRCVNGNAFISPSSEKGAKRTAQSITARVG